MAAFLHFARYAELSFLRKGRVRGTGLLQNLHPTLKGKLQILVEIQRLELWTPCLQSRCSSQLSYIPTIKRCLVLRDYAPCGDLAVG